MRAGLVSPRHMAQRRVAAIRVRPRTSRRPRASLAHPRRQAASSSPPFSTALPQTWEKDQARVQGRPLTGQDAGVGGSSPSWAGPVHYHTRMRKRRMAPLQSSRGACPRTAANEREASTDSPYAVRADVSADAATLPARIQVHPLYAVPRRQSHHKSRMATAQWHRSPSTCQGRKESREWSVRVRAHVPCRGVPITVTRSGDVSAHRRPVAGGPGAVPSPTATPHDTALPRHRGACRSPCRALVPWRPPLAPERTHRRAPETARPHGCVAATTGPA